MGELDVEQLLKRIGNKRFEEWRIAYQEAVERESWRQAGLIAATLHNELEGLRAMFNANYRPRWMLAEQLVPHLADDVEQQLADLVDEANPEGVDAFTAEIERRIG